MASMEDFKFFNMMKTSYKKVAGTNDSENAKRKKKKKTICFPFQANIILTN